MNQNQSIQTKHIQEEDYYHGIHMDFAYMTALCNLASHDEKQDAIKEIEEHYEK